MAEQRQPTPSHDVGDVGASLPSSSRARGRSVADDARQRTAAPDLAADLDAIADVFYVRGTKCTVGLLLDSMPPEAADRLRSLLRTVRPDGTFTPAPIIVETLRRHGYRMTVGALQRHRRGALGKADGCRCE